MSDPNHSFSISNGSAILNKKVRHCSDAEMTGVITALCIRSLGVSIAVTWSDLTERWHAIDELVEANDIERAISFSHTP